MGSANSNKLAVMSFFKELRRRNVIRVAIAYAIATWLLIEITATTFPILKLPDWSVTLVTVLVLIGFPLALIFAWAYELTPEGLKKEMDVDRSESITHITGRKLDFIIITVLVLALVYFAYDEFVIEPAQEEALAIASTQAEAVSETDTPEMSIAVLPFVNISADPEQEYFSDGITEEILNALSGIRELAVTSRTSAFAFKGKSMSIPKIAQELGVAHVLEGSVRKSGDRLRITAQLIEVESDKHLWSETYDRELTDIFAVQDEISENIAAALKVKLLGDTAARSGSSAVIPEAYDMYLRGLQQNAIHTFEALVNAVDYFEQSIAIDPVFVRAYAGLGWAYNNQIDQGSISIDDNLPKIRQVLHRGLELDPDNAGLIGLSGQLAYWDGDWEQAELQWRRALDLDPPHFDVWFFYAFLFFQQGRIAEALQVDMDWLEADPLNPRATTQIAFFHQMSGHFDDAFATTSRLKVIAPNNPYGHFIDGLTRIFYLGDLVTGIFDFESALKIEPNDHEAISMLAITYFSLGEMALADAWVDRGRQIAPDATMVKAADAYGLALRGELTSAREISVKALASHRQFDRWWGGFMTLRLAVDELIDRGEPIQAVDMILEAKPEWAAFRNQSPSEAQHLSANPGRYRTTAVIIDYFPDFARALRAAGDDTGADNVLAHAEANQNWRREHGVVVSETRVAEIHALRGRGDGALDALERAEKNGSIYVFWHYRLIHNRIFNEIRDHPRFMALVQRVKAEMKRQWAEFNNNRSPKDETGKA